MSQKEKQNANKLMADFLTDIGGWYQRIPDTPYGRFAEKKLFDGVYTFKGFAFEFKFKEQGATFNLNTEWRDKEPHQEIGLRQFQDTGTGLGILLIFWKRKHLIHICWLPVDEVVGVDKIKFEDWKTGDELRELMRGVRNAG